MVNRNRKSFHYGAIAFDFSLDGLDIKTHPKFSLARFILPSLREGEQGGELKIFAVVKRSNPPPCTIILTCTVLPQATIIFTLERISKRSLSHFSNSLTSQTLSPALSFMGLPLN